MKLRTKFSILTCSLTILVVTGVSLFLYIAEKKLLLEEINKNKHEIVNGLVQVSRESVISSNEILILNYLNQIKKHQFIDFAALVKPSGEITAHTNIELLGTIIDKKLLTDSGEISYTGSDGTLISALSQKIYIDNKISGIYLAGFNQNNILENITTALSETKKRIFGVALAGLIIGFIGAFLLSSMMTNPIRKMAEGADKIGRGKLETVIDVKSNDELGDLAKDLNLMAAKLAELDQMKQDFVSSITHEFRSPLNAMAIHFDLLTKGKLGQMTQEQIRSLVILKNNYKIGAIVEGEITHTADFGAFMMLKEGVEGLIHVSDMSWGKDERHPSEILKVGDLKKAKIINIEPDKQKISLGLKQMGDNPYDKYPLGIILSCKVKAVQRSGAFLEIDDNLEAYIHISKYSSDRIEDMRDHLKEGDVLENCKVIKNSPIKKMIEVSIIDYQIDEEKKEIKKYMEPTDSGSTLYDLVGDKLEGLAETSKDEKEKNKKD
ncbi:S1 RNA-binding domain-containing protein [Elusimicrobiota bacterium]